MLNDYLKHYDKYLHSKRNLDGTVTIYRRSPYSNMRFEVLIIENQYLGSLKWVMRKIVSMDSTRNDFITKSIQHNKDLAKGRKSDRRISEEIADFVYNGGMTFIN